LTGSTRFVGTDAYTTAVTAVDAFKRPTDLTVTIPAVNKDLAGSYTTTTSYLADGTTSSVDYPKLGQLSAEHVDYTYNSLGLPSTTTSSMANYVTSTLYTAFLEPSQIQFDDRSAYSLWHTLYNDEAARWWKRTRSAESSSKTPAISTIRPEMSLQPTTGSAAVRSTMFSVIRTTTSNG
jgi:hypothetical protein